MTDVSTPSRRTVLKTSGLALAAALAGCTGRGGSPDTGDGDGDTTPTGTSDDHSDGHDGGTTEPTESATVAMASTDESMHFNPHVVWVTAGGEVTWELESGAHTTTAYHPDNDRPGRVPEGTAAWDSGMLSEAGATFARTFETPGVYDYFCSPHESMGMVGSIVVGRPDPAGQLGLAEPQAEFPETTRDALAERNATVQSMLGHEGD